MFMLSFGPLSTGFRESPLGLLLLPAPSELRSILLADQKEMDPIQGLEWGPLRSCLMNSMSTLNFALLAIIPRRINAQLYMSGPYLLPLLSIILVAVKGLKLSYHNSETILFTDYPYYGNFIYVP